MSASKAHQIAFLVGREIKVSIPDATAACSGASGGSWDSSCSQAKNHNSSRRFALEHRRPLPR